MMGASGPHARPRLSETALARLRAAGVELQALQALAELSAMLDTEGRGRWHVAGELSARLARFEGGPYQRITRGARAPRDRTEQLLAAVAASNLPRSRENLWRLLG